MECRMYVSSCQKVLIFTESVQRRPIRDFDLGLYATETHVVSQHGCMYGLVART